MLDTRHVILKNPYGHLSPAELDRLLAEHRRIMRTLGPKN